MMIKIQSSLRRMPFQHVTSIVFLFVTAVLLAGGLGDVVRGAKLSAFIPVGAIAALAGWGLGTRRLNGWLSWGGLVFGGIALLWGSTAQFGGPLLQLADSLPTLVLQSAQWAWDQKVVPDFSAAVSVWQNLVTQSSGLWLRLIFWAQSMQSGENRYDPVIYVLLWSFLLWLAVAWEGWFIRREQVMTASIPSLLLLAEVIYLTNADVTPLWMMLSITLLLMGLTHFRVIFASWMKRGIDYAEIILDTTITFIVMVTLLLAVVAWVVPSISIQDIIDRLREYTHQAQPQPDPSLNEKLGLQQPAVEKKPAATGPKISATSPERHIIGPGPELSHDLVMTITTGEIPPGQAFQPVKQVPYHRWRSHTMDHYTGTGWTNVSVIETPYEAKAPLFSQIPASYRLLQQTIHVATEESGERLYWDGILQTVDQPFEAAWRLKPYTDSSISAIPFSEADILGAFSPAKIYQATSLLAVLNEKQLQAARGAYPESIRKRYLELPGSMPERVLALARQITATAPTPYDQARAIESYLRKTYPYSLNIPAPPPDRDVVDYFLFDLKIGFCDYYATSMVVMSRAIGLPARIVFGYANGYYDQTSGEYRIIKANAHAWVEVYFPKLGWVEFDPTGNQPEIDRLLENKPLADQAGTANPQLDSLATFYSKFGLDLIGWAMLGVIVLALLIIALHAGEFWLLTKLPPARAMQIIYRGLYRFGRNVAGPATRGETADEFAVLLGSKLIRLANSKPFEKLFVAATPELNLLTDLYIRAIYTPHPPEQTEIYDALPAWQALRWRLLLAGLVVLIRRPFDYAPKNPGQAGDRSAQGLRG